MSLLLEAPAAPVEAVRVPRRRRPVLLAGLLVLAGLVGTLVLAAPRAASFDPAAPTASGAPFVTVPEYGAKGAYILGYVHGARVRLAVPIANEGRLPVTVTSVELGGGVAPLVAVRSVDGLPATLWPGQVAAVTLTADLTNCRYYHERAMQIFDGVTVGFRSLGRSGERQVSFDRPILVKGPMLVGCPGRKLYRSAENQTDLL